MSYKREFNNIHIDVYLKYYEQYYKHFKIIFITNKNTRKLKSIKTR